jgi:hypothetical protein
MVTVSPTLARVADASARLVDLDAALERLDAGTYGTGETCGRAILCNGWPRSPPPRTASCARSADSRPAAGTVDSA